MRKPALLASSLAALAALYGTSYTGLWFYRAEKAKEAATQAIADLNASHPYLTYSSIETRGFPGRLEVALHKPVFDIPAGQLMLKLAALLPVAPDGSDAAQFKDLLTATPDWTERVAYEEEITLSTNLLSDEFRLAFKGAITGASTMEGNTYGTRTEPAGDSVCELKLERAGGGLLGRLWSFEPNGQGVEDMLSRLRALNCRFPAAQVKNAETGELLLAASDSGFLFTLAPQADDRYAAGLSLDANEWEFTPALDARYQSQWRQLEAVFGPSVPFAAYGKQSIHLTLNATLPRQLAQAATSAWDINLSRMQLKNALLESASTFYLHYQPPTAETQSMKWGIRFRNESTATEAYDRAARDSISWDMVKTLREAKFVPQESLARYSDKELADIVAPLVPRVSEMGATSVLLDIGYEGQPQGKGETAINAVEISTEPYAIKAAGKLAQTPPSPMPEGSVTVECRNCPGMVNDLAGWGRKLNDVFARLGSPISVPAGDDTVSALQRALADLAGNPAQGDMMRFVVAAATPMNITINERPIEQVMQTFMQALAPTPPHSSAPEAP